MKRLHKLAQVYYHSKLLQLAGRSFGLFNIFLPKQYLFLLLYTGLVMSNQRFFKIVCFRFPPNVPKKIEFIRFWNKIYYRTKMFSFRSPNFWTKSNWFVQFPNFFEITKIFVLFWEICVLNQNVLGLFPSFWMK